MGIVVLGSLAITAEADNFHHVESSSGVFAAIEGTSADGCVYTSGILFTETTPDGPVARVVTSSMDSCAEGGPLFGTHIGEASINYSRNGLSSATVSGTIEAWDYQAQLAPLTFELSLAFTGTGKTIVEQNHGTFTSPGGNVTMSFSSSRRRAATVSGSITVDGGSASVGDAFLGSGTSGDLSIAH
jgi:hypothetical protein